MGTIKVSLSTDGDGYVSQECSSCERRFKVQLGEGSDEPISFCPYCDNTGRDCWWTPDQADYLSAKAGSESLGPELEKMAKSLNKTGGFLQLTATVDHPPPPRQPDEPDDQWSIVTFDCCGELIKHDGQNSDLFCIICGVQHIGIADEIDSAEVSRELS